jgi:hypothetical protein
MPKLSDDDVQALLEEGFTVCVEEDKDDPFVSDRGVSIPGIVAPWDAVRRWLRRCRDLMIDPTNIGA